MKIEGLKLFLAVTPFLYRSSAMLDREGAWTRELRSEFRLWGDEVSPPRSGLWVWEGAAEPEPDPLVGGWCFKGTWRTPTAEEMARLAEGRFPLRGHAFPGIGNLEAFEQEARTM